MCIIDFFFEKILDGLFEYFSYFYDDVDFLNFHKFLYGIFLKYKFTIIVRKSGFY